jgi:hypothetical protein
MLAQLQSYSRKGHPHSTFIMGHVEFRFYENIPQRFEKTR